MNFDLDIISKGLPKQVALMETKVPCGTFFQNVLFGESDVMGNDKMDEVKFEWRKGTKVALPEESLRGADPTRVNFRTQFSADLVTPNYYNREDHVDLEDSDTRYFGEPITAENVGMQRVQRAFAEKVKRLQDETTVAKEMMCKQAIFDGHVKNASGTQTFPMKSDLLALTGSTLFSDPLKTVSNARNAIREANAAFVPRAIIMNYDDAQNFIVALEAKKLFEKQVINLAEVIFKREYDGVDSYGYMKAPGGNIAILAYIDVDADGNPILPRGKAIIYGSPIGKFCYGRLRAAEGERFPHYVCAKERLVAYMAGKGDNAHYAVQYQTAPLPLVTNIDGYGVLTGIPASV